MSTPIVCDGSGSGGRCALKTSYTGSTDRRGHTLHLQRTHQAYTNFLQRDQTNLYVADLTFVLRFDRSLYNADAARSEMRPWPAGSISPQVPCQSTLGLRDRPVLLDVSARPA